MFCSKCGAKAIDGAVFCQKCGAKLIQDDREVQESVPVHIQEPAAESIPSIGKSSVSGQNSLKKEEAAPESEATLVLPSEPVEMPASSTESIIETAQEVGIHEEAHSMSESDKDIYALLKENIDKCPAIKSAKQTQMGIYLRGRIYNHIVGLDSGQARMASVMVFPYSILEGLPVGVLAYIASCIGWDFMEYGSIYFEDYAFPFAFCLFIIGLLVAFMPYIGRREKAYVREYVQKTVEEENISLMRKEKNRL